MGAISTKVYRRFSSYHALGSWDVGTLLADQVDLEASTSFYEVMPNMAHSTKGRAGLYRLAQIVYGTGQAAV